LKYKNGTRTAKPKWNPHEKIDEKAEAGACIEKAYPRSGKKGYPYHKNLGKSSLPFQTRIDTVSQVMGIGPSQISRHAHPSQEND
jgi:hypothetical protein